MCIDVSRCLHTSFASTSPAPLTLFPPTLPRTLSPSNPPSHFPQCFPGEGPQLLAPALQCLLADLLSGRESGLVVAASLGVFARVLLHNPSAFLALFQAAAAAGVAPPADAAAPPGADPPARLLLALVDIWLDKFDSIGQPAARKLSALALAVLLTAPLPPLLERLELVVTHITSVWFEVGGCACGGRAGRGGAGWKCTAGHALELPSRFHRGCPGSTCPAVRVTQYSVVTTGGGV